MIRTDICQGSIASNILDPIIDSSSLLIDRTREIGLRSDSMLLRDRNYIYTFPDKRNKALTNGSIKNAHIGWYKTRAKSVRNQLGRISGHGALWVMI